MTGESVPGYSHTQKAPWFLILYAVGLLSGFVAWAISDEPVVPAVVAAVAIIMLVLGSAFQHLKVVDQGEVLALRFGPLPLLGKRIPYRDIVSVETGRTLVLDGWGVHYSVRGGWVWNIWGRSCVVIRLTNSVVRIGSDDSENLARFLNSRIGAGKQPESHPKP